MLDRLRLWASFTTFFICFRIQCIKQNNMTEKKLLECIAAYLPYGLTCEILNYKSDYIGEQYSIASGWYKLGKYPHINFETGAGKSLKEIKPLLHPMERLSNGEYLIAGETPLAVLDRWAKLVRGPSWWFLRGAVGFGNHEEVHVSGLELDTALAFHRFLLRHHFDIFGLIEKGIALPKPITK